MRIKTILSLTVLIGFLFVSNNSFAFGKTLLKQKSFQVTSQKLVEVKAAGADVFVSTWDSSLVEVKIFGKKKALKKFKFFFKKDENKISILIKKKKKGFHFFDFFNSFSYDLTVKVKAPKEFNAQVLTSGGDVKVKNLIGSARLLTSGGDVICLNGKGDLQIKTSGGDVRTTNHAGNTDVKTSGGDIEVVGASGGNISCKTSGGDIYVVGKSCKLTAATTGGDVKAIITGQNKGVSLATSGGDIYIKLAPQIKADFNFKTTGGDISVSFPDVNLIEKTSFTYSAKINGGGKPIKAVTTGGDVVVRTISK